MLPKVPETPKTPEIPKTSPPSTTPSDTPPVPTVSDTAIAGAGEAGAGSAAGSTPSGIGDLFGGAYVVGSGTANTGRLVPTTGRGPFKITENGAPTPMDRVYMYYNYFNDLNLEGGKPGRVSRGVIGFEKAFLDKQASLEVRAGYIDGFRGLSGINGQDGFTDITFVGKYALYKDRNTGDVFTVGLNVTAPTGVAPQRFDTGGAFEAVLIQPWVGGLVHHESGLYAQGFTGIAISTNRDDIDLLYANATLGYKLWDTKEDCLLTQIIPTVEAHTTIPMRTPNINDTIYFPDLVILTGGVHFGLCNSSFLTLGAAVPVTGPRVNVIEYVAMYNLRF
jgi:hypothetical protein